MHYIGAIGIQTGTLWFMGVLLIALILLNAYNSNSQPPVVNATKEKIALDYLNERYARGEITRTEYQKFKREIVIK